jgi:serine/threonine-protein kinase
VVAASPGGEVYVLDMGAQEVQRFTPHGEYLSRYAFRMDRTSETLRPLDGLAVDAAGAVYIADSVARKLRKIEADGTPGLTFTLESLVGEATDAPWLLSVAPGGEIFAMRQGGQVLRTFSAAGDLLSQTDMYAPVQALTVVERPVVGAPRAGLTA